MTEVLIPLVKNGRAETIPATVTLRVVDRRGRPQIAWLTDGQPYTETGETLALEDEDLALDLAPTETVATLDGQPTSYLIAIRAAGIEQRYVVQVPNSADPQPLADLIGATAIDGSSLGVERLLPATAGASAGDALLLDSGLAAAWTPLGSAALADTADFDPAGAAAAITLAGLGAGSAATADTGDFATAAQGALADTAVQPGDLGSAAAADTTDFDPAGAAAAITLSGLGGVPTGRAISAGTGLSGGGDLSSDRSLAVAFGSSAATVCQGNDARLSDARTPTAHTHPASAISDSTTAGRALFTAANVAAQINALGLNANLPTLSVPASTTISAFGGTLVDDADAATARGTIGIATGATDNAMLRADGTGGATLQGSQLIVGDDGTTQWIGTSTAPNAPGTGAVDLCTERSAATQVASGNYAFQSGYRCTANGAYSVAFGQSSIANGGSTLVCGSNSQANSQYSVAFGLRALTQKLCLGLGNGPGTGQGQWHVQVCYAETTDATAAVLNVDSTPTRITIPAKRAMHFYGLVTAFSDAYKAKAWEIRGLIVRDDSNNTRIVGTPVITVRAGDSEASTWTVSSITADDTNEALSVNIAGQAATNIRWGMAIQFMQMGY